MLGSPVIDPNAPIRLAYRCAHLALRAYWVVRRPETRGALAAVWQGERVLLVKSSYRRQVSLPGGYVHRGEDPRRAAARELREEVGLDLDPEGLERAWHGTLPFESRDDTLDVYETVLRASLPVRVDRREIVSAEWKTAEEALALDLVPHVRAYLAQRARSTIRERE
jgi:8-oxo-dGTP pyrophosphatase MutT (NUDIX family)